MLYTFKLRRRALVMGAMLATVTLATACGDDDPTGVDEEPEIDRVLLTVGTTTLTVPLNGAITGGPVSIRANTATPVSARFVRQDGTDDPIVTSEADFQLRVVRVSGPALTFALSTANRFAGTITATGSGTAIVDPQLFHVGENHDDFSRPGVSITVTP